MIGLQLGTSWSKHNFYLYHGNRESKQVTKTILTHGSNVEKWHGTTVLQLLLVISSLLFFWGTTKKENQKNKFDCSMSLFYFSLLLLISYSLISVLVILRYELLLPHTHFAFLVVLGSFLWVPLVTKTVFQLYLFLSIYNCHHGDYLSIHFRIVSHHGITIHYLPLNFINHSTIRYLPKL